MTVEKSAVDLLAFWLQDLTSPMEMINGRLYIDRDRIGVSAMLSKVSEYNSEKEAQLWINTVPMIDFINDVIGYECDVSWENRRDIISVYRSVFLWQIRDRFGDLKVSINEWFDEVDGDFGITITQD